MPAILLVILAALNLLALASILGWLGESQRSGEPERLAQQLNPERIVLASEARRADSEAGQAEAAADTDAPVTAAVSPANEELATAVEEDVQKEAQGETQEEDATIASNTATPTLCLAWHGLNGGDAERLGAALSRIGARITRHSDSTPNSWWVHIPPLPNREQAERQVQNLRQRGVKDLFIVQDAGPTRHAISLGVFKTEARAQVMLEQMRTQGIREARLSPRLSVSHDLEARFDAPVETAIEAASRPFNSQRGACRIQ